MSLIPPNLLSHKKRKSDEPDEIIYALGTNSPIFLFKEKKYNTTIMRKTVLIAISITAMMAMSSCGGQHKLAKDLAGSWSGAPEHLLDNSVASATILPTYDFSQSSESDDEGLVVASSLLNITTQASGTEIDSYPYSVSASGTATVEGSWRVISDDEIILDWDPKTLMVRVDPEAVVVSISKAGNPTADTDSMKPNLASMLEQQLYQAVKSRMMNIRKLDDVKVKKGTLLEYEISDHDYIMQRQGQ